MENYRKKKKNKEAVILPHSLPYLAIQVYSPSSHRRNSLPCQSGTLTPAR